MCQQLKLFARWKVVTFELVPKLLRVNFAGRDGGGGPGDIIRKGRTPFLGGQIKKPRSGRGFSSFLRLDWFSFPALGEVLELLEECVFAFDTPHFVDEATGRIPYLQDVGALHSLVDLLVERALPNP